ncbi:MAG TPA: DEAD/DEAH box helicase [Thermoplasmata archaeon]|nr:DEAD/DEAH box helicase [Thermoplasmata archaeon]
MAEILRAQGIWELYPPQAAALPHVLAGRNLLLSCPTASGKSLVAYLALLRAVQAGRTGLYLVPLRALGQEKAEELTAFEPLGVRVGLSIGDFDLSSEKLEKLDILVATSEKADGLLRRGSPWLDRLGCVVADEVHLLRDPERGPTLEVSLTRLRRRHADLHVVALSATVGNAAELAEWLGAQRVESEFRPVPLKMGVYTDGRIRFTDTSVREIPPPLEAVPRLVRTVVEDGGQALVFVSTRKSSEQAAQLLTRTVGALLSREERAAARAAADELAALGEEETEGSRRLAELLPHGVAFHNASLTNPERRVVERAFRDRRLKALAATPTLAAGINLPARRVIVRDTTRYDDHLGMNAPIPAGEVLQMCGRAGRPRYDRTGEAVLVARSDEEEERFFDQYLGAAPEDVVSRLAAEPALRMHLLALVASGEVATERELERFFLATFYGRTLPMPDLVDKVRTVREYLTRHGFLERATELRATPFGRLTSDLYLDPVSALLLRQAVEKAPLGLGPFAWLAALAQTPDLPPFYLRRGELPHLLERFTDEREELLLAPGSAEGLTEELELFLAGLKTAEILERWIDEMPVLELTRASGIGAGDLRSKVEDAQWLLFGLTRIAAAFRPQLRRSIDELALRVQYGARAELLDLVRLRGIGRFRGRQLYSAGFPDRESLRAAPLTRVASALGSTALAEMVLRELRPPRPGSGPRTPAAPPAAPTATAASPPRPRGRRSLEEYSAP